jgi:hypothetical protein
LQDLRRIAVVAEHELEIFEVLVHELKTFSLVGLQQINAMEI